MVTFDFTGLLVVAVVAFVAPLLAGLVPGRLLPAVVLGVLLGLAVGPQGLGWVKPQGAVELLYFMGLGFLLFLAGQDIDPKHFSDPMVRVTSTAYVISLALAFPVALGLMSLATGSADLRLVALCLTSSSLGIVVPVVRDAGEINSDFGQLTVMAATVGEFASLLLLTILFSADAKSTPEQILYVGIMGVAAAVTGLGLYALWRSGRMARVLSALDDTASQLRVRGAFVILLIFAGLAHGFGVDSLLGAFRRWSSASPGRPRRSSQHRDLPGQARCHWLRISHTGVSSSPEPSSTSMRSSRMPRRSNSSRSLLFPSSLSAAHRPCSTADGSG